MALILLNLILAANVSIASIPHEYEGDFDFVKLETKESLSKIQSGIDELIEVVKGELEKSEDEYLAGVVLDGICHAVQIYAFEVGAIIRSFQDVARSALVINSENKALSTKISYRGVDLMNDLLLTKGFCSEDDREMFLEFEMVVKTLDFKDFKTFAAHLNLVKSEIDQLKEAIEEVPMTQQPLEATQRAVNRST